MGEGSGRTPSSGRDASWLVSADLVAVGLAFLGQILLARALLPAHYGWMVLAIDLYASVFLIVDLGLPTLLARDGANHPDMVKPAVWRSYRWQALTALPFVAVVLVAQPHRWLHLEAPVTLLLLAGLIALVHVASYAPRSGLRALGEARLEALTKVVERILTVLGYAWLAWQESTSPTAFTAAFLLGATTGWLLSLYWLVRTAPSTDTGDWSRLGACWTSPALLLASALPFALTLSILPYVVRIEKFLLASVSGSALAAVFHVAQLAWLAGLVVPAAVRSALLPVLGSSRFTARYTHEMNRAYDLCLALLPVGLLGGYLIVAVLAPVAFPSAYFDGTYGASAVDMFAVLLAGWAFTLLATPTYTSIMAGAQPWRFTQFILLVVVVALAVGYLTVVAWASTDAQRLYGAALASSLSAGALLVLSWWMSGEAVLVKMRKDDLTLALLGTLALVAGAVTHTWWWALLSTPLLLFIPPGWRAIRPTPS